MNVSNINDATIAYYAITPAATGDGQVAPKEEPAVLPQSADTTDQSADETLDVAANDSPKVKGVVRNLLNGHFKGVADVRLRINFNEEITAMEQDEVAKIAEAGVAGITETVNSEIESLIQSGELDEETAAIIIEAQNRFTAGLQDAANNPVDNLKSGFDSLVSSLSSTLTPPEEPSVEEPSDAIVAPEIAEQTALKSAASVEEEIPATDETQSFDFSQFIGELIETFNTAMSELEASIADVSVLPELSEPKGNGAAYDKFLAIYNDMRGTTEPAEQPDSLEVVA